MGFDATDQLSGHSGVVFSGFPCQPHWTGFKGPQNILFLTIETITSECEPQRAAGVLVAGRTIISTNVGGSWGGARNLSPQGEGWDGVRGSRRAEMLFRWLRSRFRQPLHRCRVLPHQPDLFRSRQLGNGPVRILRINTRTAMVHNLCMESKYLQIGQAAQSVGLPPKTLRYYEDLGLISPSRAESGYRVYSGVDLERVRFILRAKQLGFTLNEISDVLVMKDENSEPCDHVASLIESRLAEIETRINNLFDLKAELTAVRDSHAGAASGPCRGTICHLIEVEPLRS